jgi:hypothetical protein
VNKQRLEQLLDCLLYMEADNFVIDSAIFHETANNLLVLLSLSQQDIDSLRPSHTNTALPGMRADKHCPVPHVSA